MITTMSVRDKNGGPVSVSAVENSFAFQGMRRACEISGYLVASTAYNPTFGDSVSTWRKDLSSSLVPPEPALLGNGYGINPKEVKVTIPGKWTKQGKEFDIPEEYPDGTWHFIYQTEVKVDVVLTIRLLCASVRGRGWQATLMGGWGSTEQCGIASISFGNTMKVPSPEVHVLDPIEVTKGNADPYAKVIRVEVIPDARDVLMRAWFEPKPPDPIPQDPLPEPSPPDFSGPVDPGFEGTILKKRKKKEEGKPPSIPVPTEPNGPCKYPGVGGYGHP